MLLCSIFGYFALFCRHDLSISESGMFESLSETVLRVICAFISNSISEMKFGASVFGCMVFRLLISFGVIYF